MIMSTKEICKRGLSMTISLTLGNTALPLAHCLVCDIQALGQLGLRQAQGIPPLGEKVPCLCQIHWISPLRICL